MISVGRIGGGHVVPVTYSYLGYPTTDGVPDSPVGSWTGYGSIYALWRFTARSVSTSAHSGGTAVAINVYQHTISTVDEKFVCLFDSDGVMLGSADISDKSTGSEWTGFVELTEASSGSLEFATDDELEITFAVKNLLTANIIAIDSGDSSSAIRYELDASDISTPPTPIVWSDSASKGFGIILKYIAD